MGSRAAGQKLMGSNPPWHEILTLVTLRLGQRILTSTTYPRDRIMVLAAQVQTTIVAIASLA